MDEVEQVSTMLQQMGASEAQARVMAGQLLKRAAQIAEERGIKKVAALAELLQLVRSGREGESYEPSS